MIAYDTSTALIVVDVQNDFADPVGSLAVRGGFEIIPVINAELDRAERAGATIVYTQDWHPETTPHFERDGGTWPVHCVHDTWGAALHPSLRVAAESVRVRKGVGGEDGYSAFTVRDPVSGEEHATDLEARLRERTIERVVVCGLATDYCVRATVLDARRLGFETVVLTDAIAAVDLAPGDGERAAAEMAEAGARLEQGDPARA
ncbi:MAG TPA: isochorismatase family protein [Candidatus Limnocylindria bacterium]|nr:isochorismatase family protein [Candidatus Limnocylindria bacterium]